MSLLLVALAVLLPVAAGAAEEPDVVFPDRAGAATSAGTAPPGEVQLELGVQYGRERAAGAPTARRAGVEATLTVGLVEGLEIAVDFEPVVRLRGADDETDAGDAVLTLKYRLFEPPAGSALPTLSVQPFLKLPLAQPPIGSGRTDVGAIGLATFELPGRLTVDLNAGVAVLGQPEGWLAQAVLAAGVTRGISRGVSLFADLVYLTRAERDGREQLGLDAGLFWVATPDLALDASVVTTLAGAGPDWALRAGVSVRFGR